MSEPPNFLFRLLFLLLCLAPVTALADHNQLHLTEEEQAWIKANPVITVANEMDWPPFDYVEDGEPAGYAIDLVRLIKQKTGLKVKWVNGYTWDELLRKFQAGNIDVMPAIYKNAERRRYTRFTRSYFSQPSVMVVHKDNKDIKNVSSLAGRTVAGVTNFAITTALKETVPDISIYPVKNVIEGMKAVSLGKAEAFIDSIGVVAYYLDHNYIPNLKIISRLKNDAIENPPLYFGVTRDNVILHSIIDKALASLSATEKKTLAKRWIHVPESIETMEASQRVVLTPEQKTWLAEHPVVRIGIDNDYAPYSFLNTDGSFTGVVPDFLELLGEKLGISFDVVHDQSWPQILQNTRDHELDVIATAVDTPERRSYLNFTQIYIPTPLVIMSRSNDKRITRAADLDGLTVAVVEGYSSSERVTTEHPKARFLTIDSPSEGLHAVSTGRADAYVGVVGINLHLAQKLGHTNLKVAADYDLIDNGQRFAVRSDWPELAQILDRALSSISERQRKAIYDQWIEVPYVEQVDYSLLWKAILVSVVIIALMLIHNLRLKGEIDRRQVAEAQLRESNENLTRARDEADQANQAKSRFISHVNHELRTPMNAILGFAQLLRMQLTDNEHRENAQEIITGGEHLLDLINDLQDLSRIESGTIELDIQDVSLNKVIGECIALVNAIARKYDITVVNQIETQPERMMHADPMRLKQVILNLLSNAVKYNSKGGKVKLSCEEINPDTLRIAVTDTGAGLSLDDQKKLFQPFERLGARGSDIEGTGIGLVITRQLIELMGGTIGFSSEEGGGSCFWVDIPLAQVAGSEAPA